MITLNNSKKTLNIIIEDYALRIIETNGNDLSSIKLSTETALPTGLIDNGRIQDEIGFYEFMKELVKEQKIKNRQVRFNVPHALVIMRQVEVPTSLKDKKEILQYLEIEIGKSIHLPFQDPMIDLPDLDEESIEIENETRTITFFAAPGEELRKYTEVFLDVDLKPISADVGILASYRYIHQTQQIEANRVYLVVEFNLKSVYLGIFNESQIEFLRYQDLDVKVKKTAVENESNWEYIEDIETIKGLIEDQVNELERIMNFYRFSIHKGDKMVTDIILLGDSPHLRKIFTMVESSYPDLSVSQLKEHHVEKDGQVIETAFIPALGLGIKGGS